MEKKLKEARVGTDLITAFNSNTENRDGSNITLFEHKNGDAHIMLHRTKTIESSEHQLEGVGLCKELKLTHKDGSVTEITLFMEDD